MCGMYLGYIDESGSDGPVTAGGSLTFTLACVLVECAKWPAIFDETIEYRRYLAKQFRIPVRAELKANYLLRNSGPLRPLHLSESARHAVYRGLLRFQGKAGLMTFAVVIRKDVMERQGSPHNPRVVAWEYLLQRLERFTTKNGTQVFIIHDEGEAKLVRSLARKARRAGSAGSAFGTGSIRVPAKLIIDDPSTRKSHESYFLQFADLNAYAAFRHYYPPPARKVQIVPARMWDELEDARFAPANRISGGTPGIVRWP